jgi:hypothetical protein
VRAHADEAWRRIIEEIVGKVRVGMATKAGSTKDCDGVRHGQGVQGCSGRWHRCSGEDGGACGSLIGVYAGVVAALRLLYSRLPLARAVAGALQSATTYLRAIHPLICSFRLFILCAEPAHPLDCAICHGNRVKDEIIIRKIAILGDVVRCDE